MFHCTGYSGSGYKKVIISSENFSCIVIGARQLPVIEATLLDGCAFYAEVVRLHKWNIRMDAHAGVLNAGSPVC